MTTTDSPAARLFAAADAVGRIAGQATLVARDSRALWSALRARGRQLAGSLRATPRLARVLAEALRIAALHRIDGARREVLGDGPGDGRAAARRVRELCVELRGGVLKL